jgi:outer membrane protein assembly factor BamD (BamD/ComL family)
VSARALRPLVFLVIGLLGCGHVDTTARRYKAEKMFWSAQRAEQTARLRGTPDSTTLLSLRDAYLRAEREVPPPYIRGKTDKERAAGREILHVVANARLQAGRLAVQANRPDLALAELKAVGAMAEGDTSIQRGVDFFRVATLRQFKRNEEAIALMQEMLRRYVPTPQPAANYADPILEIPETIFRMRLDMGDSTGAQTALNQALAYFRALVPNRFPPAFQAQLRAALVRCELEQHDYVSAMGDLEALRKVAASSEELKPMEPQIRYSEARIFAAQNGGKNLSAAVAALDKVATDFPATPVAPRALLEAGAMLERKGLRKEALDHYRLLMTKYPNDEDIAPLAFFRRAMLEEQVGDWETAKGILESIPVRFPESEGAVEAPLAIAKRYARVGDKAAAEAALHRAVTTYRSLIARDTTSSYCPVYRWSILQSQLYLGEWPSALSTVDEMGRRDLGHPFGAQALLQGATVAHLHGQNARAKAYLEKFIASYPKSPLVEKVRKRLSDLGKSSEKGG